MRDTSLPRDPPRVNRPHAPRELRGGSHSRRPGTYVVMAMEDLLVARARSTSAWASSQSCRDASSVATFKGVLGRVPLSAGASGRCIPDDERGVVDTVVEAEDR